MVGGMLVSQLLIFSLLIEVFYFGLLIIYIYVLCIFVGIVVVYISGGCCYQVCGGKQE